LHGESLELTLTVPLRDKFQVDQASYKTLEPPSYKLKGLSRKNERGWGLKP